MHQGYSLSDKIDKKNGISNDVADTVSVLFIVLSKEYNHVS